MTGDGVGFQLDLPVIQIKGLLRRLGQDTGGKGRPPPNKAAPTIRPAAKCKYFPFMLKTSYVVFLSGFSYYYYTIQAGIKQKIRLSGYFSVSGQRPMPCGGCLPFFRFRPMPKNPLDVADHAFWPLGGGHGPDRFAMSLQPLR